MFALQNPRRRRGLLMCIAVASTFPQWCAAANNEESKTKIYKIDKIKNIMSMTNKAAVTHAEPSYGAQSVLIPKKFIEGLEATNNASTILNLAPGINANSSNTIGVKSHISVRGFSETEVGYTYDNLPLADLFNGGMAGGNFNYAYLPQLVPVTLGETSGVNIIYGTPKPDSNSFGALGGSVDYIPKMPTKNSYTSVFGGAGSFATINYGVETNTGTTNGYGSLLVRFSSRQTDGYLQGTKDRQYAYYLAYDFPNLSETSKWSFIFLMNKNQGVTPLRVPTDVLDQYGRYYQWPRSFTWGQGKADRIMAILRNKTLLSDNLLLKTKLFYGYTNSTQLDYVDPDVNTIYRTHVSFRPPVVTVCQFLGDISPACQAQKINGVNYNNYIYRTNSFGFNPTLKLVLPHTEVDIGSLTMFSTFKSATYIYGSPNIPLIPGFNDLWDENGWRSYTKVFGQAKIRPISSFEISPGIKWEIMDTRLDNAPGYFYRVGSTVGRSYSGVSPYIGAEYRPISDLKFYANYAVGYKFPNISAFYSASANASAATPPTPITIRPERVDTYQLGAQYTHGPLDVSVSLYRSDFTNTFSSYYDVVTGLTYQYNIGSSRYQGINLAARYAVGENFSLFGNYSLQDAHFTSNVSNYFGVATSVGQPRPFTPTYLAGVGILGHYRSTSGRIYANLVGSQYIEASTGAPTALSMRPYSTLNFTLSHVIPVHAYGVEDVTLNLSGTNLLDSNAYTVQKYYSTGSGSYVDGLPMMPRSFFGNVQVRF